MKDLRNREPLKVPPMQDILLQECPCGWAPGTLFVNLFMSSIYRVSDRKVKRQRWNVFFQIQLTYDIVLVLDVRHNDLVYVCIAK